MNEIERVQKEINDSKLKGWIGVDLDGTLAYYKSGQGLEIGKPIPSMIERVRKFISKGYEVKIFTARAVIKELIPPIKEWLIENGLPDLEVTNQKDFGMLLLIDDRCKQVIENTGVIIGDLMKNHV